MAAAGDTVFAHLGIPKDGGAEVVRPATVVEARAGGHLTLNVHLHPSDASDLDLGFMAVVSGTVGAIVDSTPGFSAGHWTAS